MKIRGRPQASYAIRHEQVAVADQLFRMAHACGWTGPEPDLHAMRPLQHHKRRKFRRRSRLDV